MHIRESLCTIVRMKRACDKFSLLKLEPHAHRGEWAVTTLKMCLHALAHTLIKANIKNMFIVIKLRFYIQLPEVINYHVVLNKGHTPTHPDDRIIRYCSVNWCPYYEAPYKQTHVTRETIRWLYQIASYLLAHL